MATSGALDGVVVTALGVRGAVAVCGQLLSQLGATVIAVETVASPHRAQYSAGKLSFVPRAGDHATIERLVGGSDIVLTSSDVDPPSSRVPAEKSPRNVVCDITAFGSTGPLAGNPASELAIQALSGIMDTTGFPDGPPVPIRLPIVDVVAGTYAATAVLAAHRVRRTQGTGQFIDLALLDCAFATLRPFLVSILTNEKSKKSRMGNRHPTVAPWNLYRTTDGYVLICAGNTFGMFERLCKLIGHPDMAARFPTQKARIGAVAEMDPAIESWTTRFTTAECVEKLLAVGVAGGPLAPVEDYPREANLDFRGMIGHAFDPLGDREIFVPASPLRMSRTPGFSLTRIPMPDADRAEVEKIAARLTAAAPNAAPKQRSLEGVRIIEIGQYTTAPTCARELAHLGAEVIKVEQPAGAESRQGAEQINGVSVSFRMNNADKKMMVIDLNDAFDVEALTRLIAGSDVLVENLKPGTLSKFGFSPTRIAEINPRLVYCAISGFGADSLYPSRPAFDMVITAMAGFMTVLSADGFPLKSGISTADLMGGEMAMVAILAALEHRDRTGEGQYIDLSMQDVTAWLTQTAWNHAFKERIEPAVVKASDGYVLVEAQAFDENLSAMDRQEIVALLAGRGIQAVPIQTVREASNMPQTIARRLWFRMTEDGVDWPMLASPLRLTATPPTVSHLALPMNNDRDTLLAELGMAPVAGD